MSGRQSRFKWWYVPLGLVTAFLVIPFVGGCVAGLINAIQEDEFSKQESAVRDALLPVGDSLALGEPDLSGLPGEVDDCSIDDSAPDRIAYDLAPRGGLEDVDVLEHHFSDIWVSAFCSDDTSYYVSSVSWLPARKGELVYAAAVNKDLERGGVDDLQRLVEAQSNEYFTGTTTTNASWISLPMLGQSRYGFRFTVHHDGRQSDVYTVVFTREVVYSAIIIVVPSGDVRESVATTVPYALDARLKAQIQSADVRSLSNQ